ncbi:MAG: 3-methyl-2-oxobutanoate dehydrogenase subunit VorB [Candidatus Omnitrophica bacterium]|nr:3-methyl-2-oxobutanoate dehydrogenase subunit VorB [Candidatus Omnitrophota bacterium]
MREKILMCGNEAIGEGAIQANCQFYAGYPITPQNELTAYMARRMYEEGRVFIQSESEISAINMVFGASLAGARAMTSSSSPGISLKQEGISYLVGCELPAVIVNIMRGGPGLGNIAPSQADYFQAVKGGGHGDYKTIVLAPSSVEEAFNLTRLSFDLADHYRNPVIILGDGLLGQMMEPLPQILNSKLKIQNYPKDWALTGCLGRKPRIIRSLLLGEGELERHNQKLQEKFKSISEKEVRFERLYLEDAEFVLIAYGTVSRICKAVVNNLRGKNKKIGLIRPITLWPFPEKIIRETAEKIEGILVVEMSAGQMLEDVKLAVEGKCPVYFCGRMGGGIPTEEEIYEKLSQMLI